MTIRPKKNIPQLGVKWHRAILFLAAPGMLAALIVPISNETTVGLLARPALLVAALLAVALYVSAAFLPLGASIVMTFAGVLLGCYMTLALLNDTSIAGSAAWGFWLAVLANWGAAWLAVARLASFRPHDKTASRAFDLVIPLLFGAFVFYLWEVAVRGFGVPPVLFPPPSLIAVRFFGSLWTLWQDFFQTFILGVLSGYIIGCGAGFLVAIIAHRCTFLGRGLLPIGNFVSALPIVGIAPIMVMWFGFDWPSKAAVVVVITFFPMLVNTLAGLNAAGHIERDLMRSYGAAPGADTAQALSAGGNAVYLQRAEDQFDARFHRRDRRGILRHADSGDRLSHLHRGRAHGARHGVGGDRAGGYRRHGFLRNCRARRACDDLLASILPDLTRRFAPRVGATYEKNNYNNGGVSSGTFAWYCARRRSGDGPIEVGGAGPIRRLFRRQGQRVLQGRRSRRNDQSRRS